MNSPASPGPSAGLEDAAHTVLVVDDQPVTRRLLSRPLELAGHRVLQADSGEQALDLLASEPVDLVLLDVVMVGLDGYAVCRRIKTDERTMFIPVVMVTVLNDRSDRVRAIDAGADDFLSKPVYQEELTARVGSLLRLTDARRELERMREAQIRGAFKRYMCPKVVDDILSSSASSMRSLLERTQRREAIVLFTDLRGFTALSEQLSAEAVVEVLNEYFSEMTQAAHEYEGTIFNMSGDSLLVGFGVPFEQSAPADRAFDTAVEMQRRYRDLAARTCERLGVEVGLGIGINRGEVVFGNVGSLDYMNYTIIGDTVNVAARLEGIAQAGEVVASETVVEGLSANRAADCRGLDESVQLKGRSAALRVYRLRPD